MSRALVVVNLEIAGEPEPLVNAIDHFEAAIREHFAPYVIVNKCSVSTKNTFSRPDASESGVAMASPMEGHGRLSGWQPHEERVIVEKRELDENLGKLKAFCFDPGSPLFKALAPADRDLLEDQYTAMEQYSQILGKRIDRFKNTPMQKRTQ